jgi:hypothetical protein
MSTIATRLHESGHSAFLFIHDIRDGRLFAKFSQRGDERMSELGELGRACECPGLGPISPALPGSSAHTRTFRLAIGASNIGRSRGGLAEKGNWERFLGKRGRSGWLSARSSKRLPRYWLVGEKTYGEISPRVSGCS